MTERPLAPTLLDELALALETHLGLIRSKRLAQIWRAQRATFLSQPRLRVDFHFDIQPDVLIYDSKLGTLGLVKLIDAAGAVADQVHNLVDRATYVRHLVLLDRKRENRAPFSVELVIVTPPDEQANTDVGQALRTIAGSTQYLQSIGVNVLRASTGTPPFQPTDLRRAFPWLLVATRNWYRSAAAIPPSNGANGSSSAGDLLTLTLQDYRLRGQRTVSLSEDHHVHLVHGRNGSGKSSLVEALEFLLTGSVRRLESTTDYDAVVRNRDAGTPAKISLSYRDGSAGPFEVTRPMSPAPLPPGLNAASFRLDQTVMDQLARATADKRHKLFGEAFFPEAADAYTAYEQAAARAREAMQALPENLRMRLDGVAAGSGDAPESAVLDSLSWLDKPRTALSLGRIAECLPLKPSVLADLGSLDANLATTLAEWDKAPPRLSQLAERLKPVDDAVLALRRVSRDTLDQLQLAAQALGDVQGWRPTAVRPAEEFSEALNTWLERSALADLAERQYQLARMLKDARERGWELDWQEPLGLFEPTSLTEDELGLLKQRGDIWATERDASLNRLRQPPAETAQAARRSRRRSAARTRRPSGGHIRALDTVTAWLGIPSPVPLGQVLAQAMESGNPGTFGTIVVGSDNWAQPLLDRVTTLAEAVRQLNLLTDTPGMLSAAHRANLLADVRRSQAGLQAARAGVSQTFFRQLEMASEGKAGQSLIEAINELMALFTPARFAYRDIRLVVEDQPERRLRLVITKAADEAAAKDADADLVFNTAELNVFTVALFLLCARRVANPLRLLVLDDPLQNMDELTITYVARGLANLMRLWPADWRILLLFHGEDELERFRLELPGAVYKLPWLTHSRDAAATPINPDKERSSSSQLQDISGLIRNQPAALVR